MPTNRPASLSTKNQRKTEKRNEMKAARSSRFSGRCFLFIIDPLRGSGCLVTLFLCVVCLRPTGKPGHRFESAVTTGATRSPCLYIVESIDRLNGNSKSAYWTIVRQTRSGEERPARIAKRSADQEAEEDVVRLGG